MTVHRFQKANSSGKIPDGQLSRISLNGQLSHQGLLTATVPHLPLQLKIKSWGGKILQFLIKVKIVVEHIFMLMMHFGNFER